MSRFAYGRGIYLSKYPTTSLLYGEALVVCKVLLGRRQPTDATREADGKAAIGLGAQTDINSICSFCRPEAPGRVRQLRDQAQKFRVRFRSICGVKGSEPHCRRLRDTLGRPGVQFNRHILS